MSEPDGGPPSALIRRLRELVDAKKRKKLADKEKKDADADLESIQADTYEALEDFLGTSVSTITLDLGPGYGKQQFVRQTQVYSKVWNKDKAFESLDQRALSDELTRADFNGSALNQFVQECVDNGQELPDGIGFRRKNWVTVTSR